MGAVPARRERRLPHGKHVGNLHRRSHFWRCRLYADESLRGGGEDCGGRKMKGCVIVIIICSAYEGCPRTRTSSLSSIRFRFSFSFTLLHTAQDRQAFFGVCEIPFVRFFGLFLYRYITVNGWRIGLHIGRRRGFYKLKDGYVVLFFMSMRVPREELGCYRATILSSREGRSFLRKAPS